MPLTTTSTVQNYPTRLPLAEIARTVLGAKYDVSLTFVGKKRAQSLNVTYRNKNYIPNVLSFPLTDTVGEVYICPEVAAREAHKFDLSPRGYLAYLFIHGCLHLKGLDHGPQMDKLEQKYVRQFRLQ